MNEVEYWDALYRKEKNDSIRIDSWLTHYDSLLAERKGNALDLGCGRGNDTAILLEKDFVVTAADFSKEALGTINSRFPKAKTVFVDLNDPFPFPEDSFQVIIADLSLHYFSQQKTMDILKKISGILVENGLLLARVNSIHDVNYGAGQGREIEPRYYEKDGQKKRFFSKEDIEFFFGPYGKLQYREETMRRYGEEKVVFELSLVHHK